MQIDGRLPCHRIENRAANGLGLFTKPNVVQKAVAETRLGILQHLGRVIRINFFG